MIAAFLAVSDAPAQAQEAALPPVSAAKAQYFNANPDAWNSFLAKLPRAPAGTPTENRALPPVGGFWEPLTGNALPGGLGNPLLLTDGTVIMHVQMSETWYKLTPDINGNYVGGTVTQIGSLPTGYGPLYFASAVLPDGRVIIQGGEYNETCTTNNAPIWTNLGAIYDPLANVWTAVAPPNGTGWTNTQACGTKAANGGIGDAASIVLNNGTFMISSCCANPSLDALLNATNLTYTATGAPSTYQNEQGYTTLPNGNVLTIDIQDPNNTQLYNPGTGTWTAGPATPVRLPDPCGNGEIGPAVTRPDGTTVAFGGNSECAQVADDTAIYTAGTNSWVTGPNVPQVSGAFYTLADAPAAVLPNGNVLFAASPGYTLTPTHLFELSAANAMNQVADPAINASTSSSFVYNLLVLPNARS